MRSQERLLERNGINSAGEGVVGIGGPTVAGTAQVGQVLTGTDATFVGSGTIAITRAWLRDDVPIAGATGATYTLVVADEGARIRFRNIADNGLVVATRDSAPTAAVIAA